MEELGAWLGAGLLALGLLSWAALRLWDRFVRREIAEARRVVAEAEAEARAREAAKRQAEAQRLLLLHEVNHRAKNVLSVVQAMVRLSRPEGEDGLAALSARIQALARAHDLLAEAEWRGAELRAVAERALAPFRGAGGIALQGPAVPLATGAVQPLSMVLHELATNAVKYGALGTGGRVELRWWMDGTRLRLSWQENGGPRLAAPPQRRGFGSRVIDAVARDQLGGTLERAWRPEGLACELALPLARLQDTGPPAGMAAATAQGPDGLAAAVPAGPAGPPVEPAGRRQAAAAPQAG